MIRRTKTRSSVLRFAAIELLARLSLTILCASVPWSVSAEAIKIGAIKAAAIGPVYIGLEKGYFAAEGLDARLIFLQGGQAIAVATAAGDIDFGVLALSAAFYNLAGQGALRIIGGYIRDVPGFHENAIVASNRAYEAGLKSLKDLPGHSFATNTIGANYVLGRLAEKYGFDLNSIRPLPLQSLPNVVSALVGGQADAGNAQVTFMMPSIQRGDVKLLGWSGDETPYQLGAVAAATRTAAERRDETARFLRAYRKGVREYHDAFTGPNEERKDGPAAPELLSIIAKYTDQPVEQVRLGLGYYDADARLDVKDIRHQIDWYKSQGMLKGEIDGDTIIDKRYVIPLPER